MTIKTRLWINLVAIIVVSIVVLSVFFVIGFQILYKWQRKQKIAAEIIKYHGVNQ